VNREMNNLIETLKKSEEETMKAQQDNETDEAEGVDDMAEDNDAEGVDGMADADADEAEDVNDEAEDDDVGDADEAGMTAEGPDKSDLSDDAVENGKAVISAKNKGKKILNPSNGKIHGGAHANGKTAIVQVEKIDVPGKRRGGGGGSGRAGKKAKRCLNTGQAM
jgi:hypothetical protein